VDNASIEKITECFLAHKQLDSFTHSTMLDYVKKFMCVGGMPAVVEEYIKSNDMSMVNKIQCNLLNDYRADIGKHAQRETIVKILSCFDSIPAQLAKTNKKFKFTLVNKTARYERYINSLS
jgi:hypothetical protein